SPPAPRPPPGPLSPYTTLFRSSSTPEPRSRPAPPLGRCSARSEVFFPSYGAVRPTSPVRTTRRWTARSPSSRLIVPRRTSPAHRSEEHTSELQSRFDIVCRLLL